jgi:hypothetical protein
MMPVDVYNLLRSHIAYAAAIRNEARQLRREQQETNMKVSELSSKVDTLIGVAIDIKNRPAPDALVAAVPDDPEVERLAKRIDDAVAILRGDPPLTVPMANTFDANAPAEPHQGIDPNAPL